MKELGNRHSALAFCIALTCLAVLILLLESCAATAPVAPFAENASKAIDSGSVVFTDIGRSCERRHLAGNPVGPIFFPAALRAVGSDAAPQVEQCAVFASEGEALVKASQVLSAYFRALQQLASFNSTSVSGPGLQTGSNVALASGLSYTQIDSVSKLAGLLTQAFTERYQQRNLLKVLSQADASIASLTQGFEDIVAKDYEGLLREEQQSLPAEYQVVADVKNPAAILLLNRAFSDDVKELNRRKAAAKAFAAALQQIREGHKLLVKVSKSRKPKNLALALQPYSDTLAGLLPALQGQR